MKTKIYWLANCIACGERLQQLALRIPCFISVENGDTAEHEEVCVTIKCRTPDLPFVEEMIAEFV